MIRSVSFRRGRKLQGTWERRVKEMEKTYMSEQSKSCKPLVNYKILIRTDSDP